MSENECARCGYCCVDMDIKMLDLVFPEQFLPPEGLEFYKAHGLDKILKENGVVKIQHRCEQLNAHNECVLEGKSKPKYCVDWKCHRHLKDSQWFRDRIGERATKKMSEIINVFHSKGYGMREDAHNEIVLVIKEYEVWQAKLEGDGI